MSNRHSENSIGSIILIFLQFTALAVSVMCITYYVTDRFILHKIHPPIVAAVAAPAPPPVAEAPPVVIAPVEEPGQADMLNPRSPLTSTNYEFDGVPFVVVT